MSDLERGGADLWVRLQSEDPANPHEEEELPGDDIRSLPDGSFRWIKNYHEEGDAV